MTFSDILSHKRRNTYSGADEKHHSSPMDVFVERSTNMPIIWEKIVNNLSVNDVANCMKTSKSMRTILQQVLNTNTKLHQNMNHAATVSAIAAGKV